MTKKFTKAELDDLKRMGFVEGQPHTIPENISPAIKSRLLAEMDEQPERQPGLPGGPEALAEREARYKAVLEERDALDHDSDGRKGGHVDNRAKGGKK